MVWFLYDNGLRHERVNKGSHFSDFVKFRPHTYNLHAHLTTSAALVGGNYWLHYALHKQ